MTEIKALQIRNAEAISRDKIPFVPFVDWREHVLVLAGQGLRLVALTVLGSAEKAKDQFELIAVLTGDNDGTLAILGTNVGLSYPALTPEWPQAHLFERELRETWGIEPEGHPWMKPVRFPKKAATKKSPAAGDSPFFKMESEELHEVAVGPVHAGVIEPGHFRFQCHGERVYHLEISLGYQHRGVEKMLCGGPDKRSLHIAETLAGDTSVGHALAYAQAVEALAGISVSDDVHTLRAVALELERVANHVGDLGALAGDIGYLPTQSFCGRLRGDYLNMTALLCGSRLGRGFVRPGGIGFEVDGKRVGELVHRLEHLGHDLNSAVRLLWATPGVLARFEDVGVVTRRACLDLGIVGPAARASGVKVDVRKKFPLGAYKKGRLTLSTWRSGDVFGRARVRWLEIRHSVRFIQAVIHGLGDKTIAPVKAAAKIKLAPRTLVVSLVEGWRGEICHVVATDADGKFGAYKVIDPSFHNWTALAQALRNEEISDFPLCNKSFNLSYCGFDL